MNLIEAIKSGRPFRKKGSLNEWYEYRQCGETARLIGIGPWPHSYQAAVIYLSPDIVTGWEWEIQEPTVTISRTQFWDAYREAVNSTDPQLDSHKRYCIGNGPQTRPRGSVNRDELVAYVIEAARDVLKQAGWKNRAALSWALDQLDKYDASHLGDP